MNLVSLRTPFAPFAPFADSASALDESIEGQKHKLIMSSYISRNYRAGESPIEKLPAELLFEILASVSSPPESGKHDSTSQRLPGIPPSILLQPTQSF